MVESVLLIHNVMNIAVVMTCIKRIKDLSTKQYNIKHSKIEYVFTGFLSEVNIKNTSYVNEESFKSFIGSSDCQNIFSVTLEIALKQY